ncbi:MAG: tail fiber domain-containing protein, partial [Chloroflexales bacterium]|nr:tail fiber domain-containing protein [Chloroflexales bacterium]
MPNFLHPITQGGTPVMLTSALADLAPPALASAGEAGSSSKVARADHTHPRPTLGELGAAAVGHTHDFAALTNRPTTLAGYGITDAAAHAHAFSAITGVPSTVWMSAARPGPTRLYSTGDDSGQFVQAFLSGGYFRLNGYYADGQLYAGCSVLFADSAGSVNSVNWAGVTGRPTTLAGYGITDALSTGGNAASATEAKYQSPIGYNASWNQTFYDTSPHRRSWVEQYGGTNSPYGAWWFMENMRHSNGNSVWGRQNAWGWEDGGQELYSRTVSNYGWSGWVRFLNSNNYNAYAPTLGGGGASGTWGIHVTGNSAGVSGSTPWISGSSYIYFNAPHCNFWGSHYIGADVKWGTNTGMGGNAYANQRLRIYSTGSNPDHYPLVVTNPSGSTSLFHIRVANDSSCYPYVGAGSWAYNSDARLKENIRDEVAGIADIRRLRPVTFRYIGSESLERGFVAQDVQPVFPDLVTEMDSGMLSLKTTNLLSVIVKALQELDSRI